MSEAQSLFLTILLIINAVCLGINLGAFIINQKLTSIYVATFNSCVCVFLLFVITRG